MEVQMRVALIVGILALAGLPALSGVAAQTPSTSPKVGLSRGTLIAVGGGMPADVMARFIALAGGPDAPIVAIPPSGTCILADGSQQVSDGCTAAGLVAGRPNTNNRPRQSAVKETEALMRSFGARNVTVIETYDRTVADSAAFVAPLARASGFWAPGGVPSTLMQAFGGTRTEQELRKLLERGGVIGGTSAGAMILGSHFSLQLAPMAEDVPVSTGFGFLRDVRVQPHSRGVELFSREAASHPERIILAVDERTAWEVHGDTAEVIGIGSAFVRDDGPATPGRSYLTLRAGDRYDLATRKVTRAAVN
jgi:cyanophycinase-like exopeptidase